MKQDEVIRQIRATVAANREMIKKLTLQNQALAALLPKDKQRSRPDMVFNPISGGMERVKGRR